MMVTLSWNAQADDDVDLHVIDPYGNEYYYDAKSYKSYPESDAS